MEHPCQKCGACCSSFQVSFRSAEILEHSYNVPGEYTVSISKDLFALRFENPGKPRCLALQGKIGHSVSCKIYENRPSPCRNFKASFEDGTKNNRCDQARARMGLPELTLEDWNSVR
jgi:Fe-S-cluster containining protein